MTGISMTLALSLLAAGAQQAGGLLARWDFEGERGRVVVDASGRGLDGEARPGPTGATPQRIDAMVGTGMRFDARSGSDVVVKNGPRLNPTDGLTVAAWIKLSGPPSPAADIVSKKGVAKSIVDGYRFYVSKVGRLCLEVGDGQAVSRVGTSRRAIRPGVWCHVAGTFAPGRMRLYINSRLVVDEAVPAKRVEPSRNHLVLGNFAGRRNAYPFSGIIDEVNLFGVALAGDAIFGLAKPDQLRQ